MNSRTILRSGVIAAGALTASVLAASAAQAHGGQSGGTDRRNPGMQRMHELHMQDRDRMGSIDMHRHGR